MQTSSLGWRQLRQADNHLLEPAVVPEHAAHRAVSRGLALRFQPSEQTDWTEKNICFEPLVKMAYGEHGKEFAMINQDIQPSPAIADRMSYWLLAALMTFGVLGAILLPVAALVLY